MMREARRNMEQRPDRKTLAELRARMTSPLIDSWVKEALQIVFAEIEALAAERDAAHAASEINFAAAKRREREALRRGFDAAQAWNLDEEQPKYPTWEHFEEFLEEEKEYAAGLVRIAEAEEGEKWPHDT